MTVQAKIGGSSTTVLTVDDILGRAAWRNPVPVGLARSLCPRNNSISNYFSDSSPVGEGETLTPEPFDASIQRSRTHSRHRNSRVKVTSWTTIRPSLTALILWAHLVRGSPGRVQDKPQHQIGPGCCREWAVILPAVARRIEGLCVRLQSGRAARDCGRPPSGIAVESLPSRRHTKPRGAQRSAYC